MHIKLTNGIPEKYTIEQLRRDNPNVSFPRKPTDALLSGWDVYPLVSTDHPAHDSLVQTIEENTPVNIDGVWTQQWTIHNRPQEEAERNVRNKRDHLLFETDWTQVADAPVNQVEWANYRQALRDIPQQEGFPYSVTWPTEPV